MTEDLARMHDLLDPRAVARILLITGYRLGLERTVPPWRRGASFALPRRAVGRAWLAHPGLQHATTGHGYARSQQPVPRKFPLTAH